MGLMTLHELIGLMVLFKYMMGTQSKNRGFTIVELLIVIVVIGILAAITIVSFNGVSTRAKNTQMIALVESYQKGLAGYFAENSAYPSSVTHNICLGTGYKDYNSDTKADCGATNQSYRGSVDTAFNASLAPYLSGSTTGPTASKDEYPTYGDTNVGATLVYDPSATFNGVVTPYRIMYVIKGVNQDCGLRIAASSYPAYTTTTAKYTYSDSTGGGTTCVVMLPNA